MATLELPIVGHGQSNAWALPVAAYSGDTIVLVNANARGFSERRLSAVVASLRPRFGTPRVLVTRTEGAALFQLADAVRAGARQVICVGGDGTMNLALNALGDRDDVRLGVVPWGTANDLATEIGSADAGEQIRALDILRVDGRRVATVGLLGIASEVAAGVKRIRARPVLGPWARRLGPAVYPVAALAEILKPRAPLIVSVRWRDAPGSGWCAIELPVSAAFFCNQQRLGGTMTVNGVSTPDDGRAELVLVPDRGPRHLLGVLARMLRGKLRPDDVTMITLTEAEIRTSRRCWFCGDGEPMVHGDYFELEVEPSGQEFLC